MKISKILICWIIVLAGLLLAAFAIFLSNKDICIHYEGFSVDDAGNIYIGKYKRIDVISPEGELLRTIDVRTNHGYYFTISDQNTIYLNATGHFMILDLDGNLLSGPVDYNDLDHPLKLDFERRRYVAPDGTVYVLQAHFGRLTIYRMDSNGKIPVYKMPIPDCIVRALLILAGGSLFGVNLLIVILLKAPETQRRKVTEELRPVYSHATKQEMEESMKKPDFQSQWKSIPKWMLPAAIVFFAGCIILMRLIFAASEDMQMYYRIGFLAWSIICCTIITILLMRSRKK